MRSFLRVLPLALAGACAQACAVSKALYVAVVHNSGAPPRAERDRIESRETAMLRTLPSRRLLVLPVTVIGRATRFDTAAASLLAARLNSRSLANATVSLDGIELPFERQPNEALIFWTRFKGLSDSIRAHPRPGADYVLLVDVFGSPSTGLIGAVHVVAVTAGGDMAYRRLWNSHQPLFREIRPASLDDVARMIALDIERATK